MRRLLTALTLALLTGACAGDTTGPDDTSATLDDMAAVGYAAMQVGEAGDGDDLIARLGNLPAALALSPDQIARIKTLVDNFVAATTADRDALAAIAREAAAARQAGKSADEVRAILARGAATRARLQQSERALREAVMAVLTPAQRAALFDRPAPQPRSCALTDAQRTEISGLLAAFEQANAADIAIIRGAHARARTAQQSGATREQVAAILAEARAASARIETARAALRTATDAVLTTEQRAAGCARTGPRPGSR